MPRLSDSSALIQGAVQGFQFSGARPERLGASEYTLATIVVDITGSVSSFERDLAACVASAVEACRQSPRSENMLVRLVAFNETPRELFGFMPLEDIQAAMLDLPDCSGSTALIDAVYACSSAANAYGKTLYDQDYLVNACAFLITDGDDNCSRMPIDQVAAEIRRGAEGEWLQSSSISIIGVNAARYERQLKAISQALGAEDYIDAGDASPANLAKVARFISRSISSSSQTLAGGAPAALSYQIA